MNPATSIRLQLLVVAALLTAASRSGAQTLYRSSVVGTDFDFVVESDPDTFVKLESKGQDRCEMPDKTSEAPLRQQAFVFVSHYSDGSRVHMAIDADFATEEKARKEAMRYVPRLGRLPTSLRGGVERLVVHKGGEDATAFSDVGLIVVYSDNATKRIGTHDLEETIFHESVHAAWDKQHEESAAWLEAQRLDGGFLTGYAEENHSEDLAESALFAYTLLHHPERIPAAHAAKIRKAIPARISFVGALLPAGRPLHYPVPVIEPHDELCAIDLRKVGQLEDVLSNALMCGLGREENEVTDFLEVARRKASSADQLTKATAGHFKVEEKVLKQQVEAFRHCNCTHEDLGGEPDGKSDGDSKKKQARRRRRSRRCRRGASCSRQ